MYSKNTTIEETRKWFKSRFGLEKFAGGQCPIYGGLRTQFGDLEEDCNLVAFFTAVLDRRDKLEEDDRRQQS